jgi:serine/threonine protein kinase
MGFVAAPRIAKRAVDDFLQHEMPFGIMRQIRHLVDVLKMRDVSVHVARDENVLGIAQVEDSSAASGGIPASINGTQNCRQQSIGVGHGIIEKRLQLLSWRIRLLFLPRKACARSPFRNIGTEMTTPATPLNEPNPSRPDTRESIETFAADLLETQIHEAEPAPVVAAPRPAPRRAKISTLGDYRLLAKLGEGGMGIVYKALQIKTKRLVAVKVLGKEHALKPGFVDRFRREVRILGRLNHRNIVRHLAAGEAHGFIYLAMELVDGGSLASWLAKLGKLPIGDAIHIARACATALQYAHEQNLIHRDVKPDNILLNKAGAVKLTDLGLARSTDESDMSYTRTGTGIGTPLYAPPEQARDAKRVDARGDIYALGGVLYHCLTGQPPFYSSSLMQMILIKEVGKYLPASQLNSGVPSSVDDVLARMLDKSPDQRYPSCADVIVDLDNLRLANERLSFLAAT